MTDEQIYRRCARHAVNFLEFVASASLVGYLVCAAAEKQIAAGFCCLICLAAESATLSMLIRLDETTFRDVQKDMQEVPDAGIE